MSDLTVPQLNIYEFHCPKCGQNRQRTLVASDPRTFVFGQCDCGLLYRLLLTDSPEDAA
jgi:hypothetical protein